MTWHWATFRCADCGALVSRVSSQEEGLVVDADVRERRGWLVAHVCTVVERAGEQAAARTGAR